MTSTSSNRDGAESWRVKVSSFCSDGDCLGVATTTDGVSVVDTKTSARLTFSASEWAAFIAGVKAGEFDLP